MTELERIEATSEGYRDATALLRMERLILAAMNPGHIESRPHVIAQSGRVQALQTVVDHFARDLVKQTMQE